MWKSLFGGKKKGPAVGGNKELLTIVVDVPADAETAFKTFVDNLTDWWPRELTWGGDQLKTISIDPKLGGQCIEENNDGTRQLWGTVLSISRPTHLVIAWRISPDRTPEDSEATASRIDVRFSQNEAGTTSVLVVHRDFPRHQTGWEKYRDDMAGAKGWPMLLERYRSAFGDE
jgi:uncharacterized protein YndB with AHSA1/START domain